MGTAHQTRHLTPGHYGETVEKCPVTILLLRAWMLGRAHRDGWANAKASRKRQLAEERQLLQRDILEIQSRIIGAVRCAQGELFLSIQRVRSRSSPDSTFARH